MSFSIERIRRTSIFERKEHRRMFEEYPKEEMYDRNNTKQHEIYTKNNVIASKPKDASELKKILLEWDRSNKKRAYKQRSKRPFYTRKRYKSLSL